MAQVGTRLNRAARGPLRASAVAADNPKEMAGATFAVPNHYYRYAIREKCDP